MKSAIVPRRAGRWAAVAALTCTAAAAHHPIDVDDFFRIAGSYAVQNDTNVTLHLVGLAPPDCLPQPFVVSQLGVGQIVLISDTPVEPCSRSRVVYDMAVELGVLSPGDYQVTATANYVSPDNLFEPLAVHGTSLLRVGGPPPGFLGRQSGLLNISTAGQLDGLSGMAAGFVIYGDPPRDMVITAERGDLPGARIDDPRLTVSRFPSGERLATNDDWSAEVDFDALVGRTPAETVDAALSLRLPAGQYVATVTDAGGVGGGAIVGVTEANRHPAAGGLLNISTAARVDDEPVRAGFIVDGSAPRDFLLLAEASGATPLPDPTLALKAVAGGQTLAENDNWYGYSAEVAGVPRHSQDLVRLLGRAPAGPDDAGLLVRLPPGAYYAEVDSLDGRPGSVLISVTEVATEVAP